jgi:Fe-S oxidoreductase
MGTKDHSHCSGCSLCLLACPVWRQTKDIRLTPHGRAKALQHGASIADLGRSISSCTLCGACEPACPEDLPLVEMVLGLRKRLPLSSPGKPEADAAFLARQIECGLPVDEERLARFLTEARGAPRLVVAEPLLIPLLRERLPGIEVVSLGYALSSTPEVRAKLRASDLYVIEPRAFHADYANLLGHYDALRQATGMATNLDLQRLAIPTTASSAQHHLALDTIDAADQARWILEGRSFERVVVEDPADLPVFSQVTDRPVVHLADL